MRSTLLVLTLTLVALSIAADVRPAAAEDLDILLAELQVTPLPATAPPPFKLETLDGKSFSLADLRGRPAILYFWATW